jgi:type IV secretion system protein VirB9
MNFLNHRFIFIAAAACLGLTCAAHSAAAAPQIVTTYGVSPDSLPPDVKKALLKQEAANARKHNPSSSKQPKTDGKTTATLPSPPAAVPQESTETDDKTATAPPAAPQESVETGGKTAVAPANSPSIQPSIKQTSPSQEDLVDVSPDVKGALLKQQAADALKSNPSRSKQTKTDSQTAAAPANTPTAVAPQKQLKTDDKAEAAAPVSLPPTQSDIKQPPLGQKDIVTTYGVSPDSLSPNVKKALLMQETANTRKNSPSVQPIPPNIKPAPPSQDDAATTYEYQSNRIYPVRTGLGITTEIELNPSEKILDYSTGFSSGWDLTRRDNVFYLKPKNVDVDTNLMIRTETHSYTLELKVVATDWRTLAQARKAGVQYHIRFTYPADAIFANQIAKTEQEPELSTKLLKDRSYNFDYDYATANTDFPWLIPVNVWDDGNFTYIRMPDLKQFPTGNFPSIYMREEERSGDSLVNTSVQGNTIIVHGTYNYLVLRQSDKIVALRRNTVK